jgi:hypothetical protein
MELEPIATLSAPLAFALSPKAAAPSAPVLAEIPTAIDWS